MSGFLTCGLRTSAFRLALVRIELLLNDSLRPRLLAGWLMLGVELYLAEFTDPDDRNIFDSLYYPKTALGHEHSFPQFGPEGRISRCCVLSAPPGDWISRAESYEALRGESSCSGV